MKWQLLVLAAASLASAQDYNIFTPDQGPTDMLEVPKATRTFQCYDVFKYTSYTMLLTVDYPKEMTAAVYIASHNNFYNGVFGLSRIDTPVSISYSTGAMGTECFGGGTCSAARYDVLAYAVTGATTATGATDATGNATASVQDGGTLIAQKFMSDLACFDGLGGPFKSIVLANYMVTANYSRTVPLAPAVNVFSMSDESQILAVGLNYGALCESCLPGTTCCSVPVDYVESNWETTQPAELQLMTNVDGELVSGQTFTWFPTGSRGSAATSGGHRGAVSIIFVALSATAALFAAVLFV